MINHSCVFFDSETTASKDVSLRRINGNKGLITNVINEWLNQEQKEHNGHLVLFPGLI